MIERFLRFTSASCFLAAVLFVPGSAAAQDAPAADISAPQVLLAAATIPAELPPAPADGISSSLPDDPATVLDAQQQDPKASLPPNPPTGPVTANGLVPAHKYADTILPTEQAQHLNAKEKIAFGFRELYDPFGLAGIILSAGYSQATNGQPNYGTDRGAFGQRLGAGGLRYASQEIFTDSILHPLMRTDPRYYVKGSQYSFGRRTGYAISRLWITRKDDGGRTVNSALLLGYLEAASMTRFYYPNVNKNFKDLMTGYGGSLGGAALNFVATEFSDSILRHMHIRH